MRVEALGRRRSHTQRYVVIGGGVAGVTAVEELFARKGNSVTVTLITAARFVKQVAKVLQVSRKLEELEISERDALDFASSRKHLQILQARVQEIDVSGHRVICDHGRSVPFERLLLCSGAAPRLVAQHDHVIGIRDTESIEELSRRVQSARRIMVIGNGGIALEIVHEICSCEVIWAVKDNYVGNTFFDRTASAFILPELQKQRDVRIIEPKSGEDGVPSTAKRRKQAEARSRQSSDFTPAMQSAGSSGGALGPHWKESFVIKKHEGTSCNPALSHQPLQVIFGVEMEELVEPGDVNLTRMESTCARASVEDWPLYIRLTDGQVWGCDFVVSATGVVPNVSFLGPDFERGGDGGVLVNDKMQTSASADIYAAGDCCSIAWPESDVWFQLRLWSQARNMAIYAVQSMTEQVDELGSGFAFELFAHVTRFFGFRVALLGCFNAQHLPDQVQRRMAQEVIVSIGEGGQMEIRRPNGSVVTEKEACEETLKGQGVELLTRVTPGVEYVKVVVVDGKIKGAMLVGESTESAETFENLILNQVDVSRYGIGLLDSDIDIDDYFD